MRERSDSDREGEEKGRERGREEGRGRESGGGRSRGRGGGERPPAFPAEPLRRGLSEALFLSLRHAAICAPPPSAHLPVRSWRSGLRREQQAALPTEFRIVSRPTRESAAASAAERAAA